MANLLFFIKSMV